jgi:uncharacterized protein (UPF0276 family)
MPFGPSTIPTAAGVGLRAPHVSHVLTARPAVAWLEVHSENYFIEGGPALAALERVRADYPVSLHGVGLALGSCAALDRTHLAKLARLADRLQPGMISEHLSWGRTAARHYNELLPMPYTREALDLVASRIGEVQDALALRILVENIAAYVTFAESEIPEAEFLAELARRTGCGLLLDVNNVYVNARNRTLAPAPSQGTGSLEDARTFIDAIPPAAVSEMHLAGFEPGDMLIDTHGRAVAPEVWDLYEYALSRIGPRPTLVEWDTDIPPFEVLHGEASKAQARMQSIHAVAA